MTATELVNKLLGEELGLSSAKTIGTDGESYTVKEIGGRKHVVGYGQCFPVYDDEQAAQLIKKLQVNRNIYNKNQDGKSAAGSIKKFDKA